MQTMILATRNSGKVKEICSILKDLPLEFHSVSEYPHIPDVIEDGSTLKENALKKARQIFNATSIPTLSDDTGLEVIHLNRRPGVISARYSGENATYAENNQKLLDELLGFPLRERIAEFRCVAVFTDGKVEFIAEGICQGHISEEPHGVGGFGYDPIFVPRGYNQTFAEIPEETKNTISHRAKAFRKMAEMLPKHFGLI